MPFCEVSVNDQRREFVVFAAHERANVRELCRRFGISPTTGYKWLGRFRREGLGGLGEGSRRPHVSPTRIPSAIEAKVKVETSSVVGSICAMQFCAVPRK